MTRDSLRKRAQDDEDNASDSREAKRPKGEETRQKDDRCDSSAHPKSNRLQRAIFRTKRTRISTTEALARKIRKAEKDKGLLTSFMDAPVDIFYEVSSHLLPADLLSLSRVSNQMREFLLSKSNRQVWVTSFANTDLPPCPRDLNEPQYANLMFGTGCMVCDAPYSKTLNCELRLRLCNECFNTNVIEERSVVREFLASTNHNVNDTELAIIRESATKYIPFTETVDKNFSALYYKPDFLDALSECLNAYRSMTETEYQAFVAEKAKSKYEIDTDTALLHKWVALKARERTSELADIGRKHEESVKSRLREIGYTDEDWSYTVDQDNWEDMKEWDKLTRQKKKLTNRTWKTLLPKLEEFLDMRREKIRYTKRRAEFRSAYTLHHSTIQLTFGESEFINDESALMRDPAVCSFMYYDDADREITAEVWSAFLPTLDKVLYKMKKEILVTHIRNIVEWRSEKGKVIAEVGSVQQLFLASSFFVTPIFETCFGNALYYFNSMHSIGSYPAKDNKRSKMYPFWYSFQDISPIDLEIPDALLKDLELPLTTTMLSMQDRGKCFVCIRCPEVFRSVMNWSELVLHYVEENNIDNTVCNEARRRKLGIKLVKDHAPEGSCLARIVNETEAEAVTAVRDAQSNLLCFRRITAHLRRTHASILMQLRTGHIPLNDHLHRITKAESPYCPYCPFERETVHHFLLRCPKHDAHRIPLMAQARQQARDISKLLTQPKLIQMVLRYVRNTGRLQSIFKRIEDTEISEKGKILTRRP